LQFLQMCEICKRKMLVKFTGWDMWYRFLKF
jgi:hypothetical protein